MLKSKQPDIEEAPEDGRPSLAPDMGDWTDGEKYEEFALPPGRFWLQDADHPDDIDGPFDGDEFLRDDETGAYYSQTEGRPIFLRIIHSDENEIWSVDGSNQVWHYVIT